MEEPKPGHFWSYSTVSVGSLAKPDSDLSTTEQRNSPNHLAQDSLASGLAFMLLANVGQRGIGFFRNLSFCRFLDEGSLGLWALASSFLLLAAPLAVLGLPGTFGKLIESYRLRKQLRPFLIRIAAVSSIGVVVVSALLLTAHRGSSGWIFGTEIGLGSMSVVVFALLSVVLFNTATELLNGLRKGRVVSAMHTVNSLSFTAFSLIGLLVWQDWRIVLIAFALASLCGLIPGLRCLWGIWSESGGEYPKLSQSVMWNRVVPFAMSIWVMNLLSNLFDVIDRYMLLYLADSQEQGAALVGQFHSARILPLLLTSLTMMLSSMLLPYLAADWESGNKHRVKDALQLTSKLSMGFFFLLSILSLAIAPTLFNQFLEGRFSDGLAIMPIALSHCCFLATGTLLQNYFWCIEKGRVVGFILALGLLINFALNLWWVPIYGLVGAMAATTVAGGAILALTWWSLYCHGIELDRNSFILSLLPVALLFGALPAMCIAAVLIVLTSRTSLLLSTEEKNRIDEAIVPQLQRFGIPVRTLWHIG